MDSDNPMSYQLLLCAVLENAMQESAKLRRLGFWEEDPLEMNEIQASECDDVPSYVLGRVLQERMFWGGRTCQVLLDLVGMITALDVSRQQLVRGIRNISASGKAMCSRRGASGGTIKL